MRDREDRFADLRESGPSRHMRMVSGPQGPRVVLDGRPVLLLCSHDSLGLADHPDVREAAADAAMRWGVGAGGTRHAGGTMTLHRRLEERIAAFLGTEAALLFGAGYLAAVGVIPALARPGEVVFSDERNHAAIGDGCRAAGAACFAYRHGDVEHLAWALRNADGRGALIVTEGISALDGDVAPLEELVALARRHRLRLLVDDGAGIGCAGPGGRGAVAAAGLEDEVDVVIGTLGRALGGHGGFAACADDLACELAAAARPIRCSTAPPPVAVAAALAAFELLEAEPRRVGRLRDNAALLRDALARERFDVTAAASHILPIVVGDAGATRRIAGLALDHGVYVEERCPPVVPDGASGLRLAVMATHTRTELREAAHVLGRAALRSGFRPGAGLPLAA